ncbi:ionotropic receptor 93a-like [Scylla paramamosain]|uniref:ionotropic receptor 93a-like n=1 Tax=Scylla paramamosain TaxID=85552 RepID=UPI0030827074
MLFINVLYRKERLKGLFTWRPRIIQSQPLDITAMQSNTPTLHSLQDEAFPTKLFPDKTRNLWGATLNVGTFNFPPAVIYRRENNGSEGHWYGDNIFLAEAVGDVLNFSLRYRRPPAGEFWGKLTVNGSWDGLVGMLARGEADIVLANLFVANVKGRTKFQEYTFPHGQVETCFMVKKPSPLPRWQSVSLPYTLEVWLAVMGVILLAGPLLHTLAYSSVSRDGDKLACRSLPYLSLYTLAMHFRVSQTVLPLRTSLQVFVVFLWVHIIIVTVAYSANLTAFLTVERIPEGITSLKQLYDSKLFVYGIGGPFFADNMAESGNEYVRGLVSRFVPMPSSEIIYSHLMRGRGVHIDALNHLSYVKSLYTDSRGFSTLRIIQECFQPYSVAMGVQSHSPLKRNFNIVINWIFEAGLVSRWFEETLTLVKKYKREDSGSPSETEKSEVEDSSEETISLTMEHLQGLFVILCIGFATAAMFFIVEFFARKKYN